MQISEDLYDRLFPIYMYASCNSFIINHYKKIKEIQEIADKMTLGELIEGLSKVPLMTGSHKPIVYAYVYITALLLQREQGL